MACDCTVPNIHTEKYNFPVNKTGGLEYMLERNPGVGNMYTVCVT